MSVKARFIALSERSSLEVLIPQDPAFDVRTLVGNGAYIALAQDSCRKRLFFDEEVQALVLLKTKESEEAVKQLLPGLDVILSVHASDTAPQSTGNTTTSAPGKFDLGSRTYTADESPEIFASEENTLIAWKLQIHLSRPRVRVQQPNVHLTASISVNAANTQDEDTEQKEILRSYEPLPANVLEALRYVPSLRASEIYLAEPRVNKLAPRSLTSSGDAVRPIRATSTGTIPASPALYTRVKYSGVADTIIASLHLEASSVLSGTLRVHHADLKINGLEIDALTDVGELLDASPGDENVILYKIYPQGRKGPPQRVTGGEITPVTITIGAEILSSKGNRYSTLNITWQTQLDLSHPIHETMHHWSRPLSTTSKEATDSRPISHGTVTSTLPVADTGITFNFTGPPTVYLNETFKLSVQCNNKSTRARRFTLAMIPDSPPPVLGSQETPTSGVAKSSKAPKPAPETPSDPSVSQPTQSHDPGAWNLDAQGFNAISSAAPTRKAPDVLDLNPDLHIGPIPARASFETEMVFRAVRVGVVDFGMLRIFDVDSKRAVDVRELPDVVVIATTAKE